jgi:hypothetical protein
MTRLNEINPNKIVVPQKHTSAWVFQTWASFILSVSAMTIGILYLPSSSVNAWIKGYLGMGLAFTVGSTISLSKTIRDIEENKRFE